MPIYTMLKVMLYSNTLKLKSWLNHLFFSEFVLSDHGIRILFSFFF